MWGRLSKVITKESVLAPVTGMFYQDVVGTVLLYGNESWMLPPLRIEVSGGVPCRVHEASDWNET